MKNAIPSIGHNTYASFVKSCRMISMGWILCSLGLIVVFLGLLAIKLVLLTCIGIFLLIIGLGLIFYGISQRSTSGELLLNDDDVLERLELFRLLWDQIKLHPFICLIDDGLSPRIALILTSTRSYILSFVLDERFHQTANGISSSIRSMFSNVWKDPVLLDAVITRQEFQIQMQRIEEEWDGQSISLQDIQNIPEFAKFHGFLTLFGDNLTHIVVEPQPVVIQKPVASKVEHSKPMTVSISEPKIRKAVQDKPIPIRAARTRVSRGRLRALIIPCLLVCIILYGMKERQKVIGVLRTYIPLEWQDECGLAKIEELSDKNIQATTVSSTKLYADLGGAWAVNQLRSGDTVTVLQREIFGDDIWYFINTDVSKAGWTKATNLKFLIMLPPKTQIYLEPNLKSSNSLSPVESVPYVTLKKYVTSYETWLYIRTVTQDEGWIQGEGLR